MLSPGELIWLLLIGAGLVYLWRSGQFKGRARDLAQAHCREFDLQLLDQGMVIVGLWPTRDAGGRLVLRRRYRFEFTSTGDQRYQGEITLLGLDLARIDLEPFRLPPDD